MKTSDKSTQRLEQIADLFIKEGAKTLTMDDLAKSLGVSKKTLYQEYDNKETLLKCVLDFMLSKVMTILEDENDAPEHPIEWLLRKESQLKVISETNKNLFIRQLIKYYPSLFEQHINEFSVRFTETLKQNIQLGQRLGVYRQKLQTEFYGKWLFQSMLSYDSSPFWGEEFLDRSIFNNQVLLAFLYSITNEKGRVYLANTL